MRRTPTLGVGVFVMQRRNLSGTKILLGRRGPARSRGVGCLALPGGHVESGATLNETTISEVFEECGVACHVVHFNNGGFHVPGVLGVTDHWNEGIDHLTFWMLADHIKGEPTNREPTKCLGWHWYGWDELVKEVGQSGLNRSDPQFHWTPLKQWAAFLRLHMRPKPFAPIEEEVKP